MDSAAALWGARVAEATLFPDQRLHQRFASVLGSLASQPLVSIPQACGDWAATKAAYRFLENRRVLDSDLLQGIARHTARQAALLPEVLVVQDSSSLNFSRWHALPELGSIDSAGLGRGLLFHTSLALDAKGKVLGLLDWLCWTRPQAGQPKPPEKESGKWLQGLERCRQVLAEAAPGGRMPRPIQVMDREGDCFDLLSAVDDAGDSAIC